MLKVVLLLLVQGPGCSSTYHTVPRTESHSGVQCTLTLALTIVALGRRWAYIVARPTMRSIVGQDLHITVDAASIVAMMMVGSHACRRTRLGVCLQCRDRGPVTDNECDRGPVTGNECDREIVTGNERVTLQMHSTGRAQSRSRPETASAMEDHICGKAPEHAEGDIGIQKCFSTAKLS